MNLNGLIECKIPEEEIKSLQQLEKYNNSIISYQLQMAARIKQDLQRMAESITINAHYPCNLGNLNILFQYEFYFDICQILFPELNIKLVKIKSDQELDAGEKLDQLIHLLSSQLQIDLSSIKGAEVIKGQNITHVHRFLQFLEKFSEIHQANQKSDDGSRRVRSDPNTSERIDEDHRKVPRSARQKIQDQIIDDSQEGQEIHQSKKKRKSSRQKRAPEYSKNKKQQRTRLEASKNLYSSLINIMMNEKNRTIKASLRDNRKNKNEQIIQAKNKYKSYLINFAKQNRAAKNRQSLRKQSQQKNREQLPLEDFQNIQNFFKSFQFQLRDKKYCYLKRIEKLVRSQQIDRMCYLNKIEQQKKNQAKVSTKKEMERIENEHQVKSHLLKEGFESQKQANKLMKKEYQKYLRTQKKQLKENKKKELEKIKDFMKQENGKVLFSLEQGGRLEKVILDMYKRF